MNEPSLSGNSQLKSIMSLEVPTRRTRSSVVCIREDKILVFDAVDPHSKTNYVFLPGGKIEEYEDACLCGVRETLEETGHKVKVIAASEIIKKYMFRWNNQDIFCETHFFRAEIKSDPLNPLPVNDASYNKGALWLPLSEVDQRFKYSRPILLAVKELIVYRVRQ